MKMFNAEQVIAIYENMSDLTGQMLDAARSRDWETLVELETRCAGHVRTLQAGEGPVMLAGPSRDRKISLIHKILADDKAIRDLTSPWMAELSALMSSARTERKLHSAYGT
jgi:flagellar protein FliT